MKTFNSVASLKLAKIKAGERVARYYYEKGDAGYAEGIVKTSAQALAGGDVIDERWNVTLANGNVWIGIAGPFINPAALGSAINDISGLSPIGCAFKVNPQPDGVDNTFAFIDDSEHDPVNCTGLTGGSLTFEVTHEQPLGSDVVGTAIVAPDETMIKRGVMVGASVGTEISVITATKRHSIKLDWAAAALTASDLVVDGFMDSSRYIVGNNLGTTGAYRINHPETLDGLRAISPIGLDAPDVVMAEVTGNTVDLFPYRTVRITAKRSGGAWSLTGQNPTETAAINALGFSVTDSGNLITVNHPSVLSGDAQPQAQFVGVNYYRYINIFSKSATSLQVAFINSADTPQPPTNGDEFYITLHQVLWEYGFSSLDLGILQLNPQKDFKDIASSNNFWLMGNHWALK